MLISPTTPSSSASARVVSAIRPSISSPRLIGGRTQAESPEWTPGLLDVLHHSGEHAVGAVGERVDVDLDGVLEEAVEEQRVLAVGLRVAAQVGREVVGRVADLHRPAAEHVGGADEQRKADPAGDRLRLLGAEGGAVGRMGDRRAARAGRRSGRGPRPGRSRRPACRAGSRRRPRAAWRAAAASGRRTGRSRPPAAPARSRRGRRRRSAARSRGGRRCRSRSRPSPGCS